MKLKRDPSQPVDLVLMQKRPPFHHLCLPVASSYAVCLRFTCWSTRHEPCAELASKTPAYKNLLLVFLLRPLPQESPSARRLKLQPHFFLKTFQVALPVSSLTPPQKKKNVLFSYSLHALLFSAGTQTNDCGFQLCVDCFVNTFNRMSWLFHTLHTPLKPNSSLFSKQRCASFFNCRHVYISGFYFY